jgi:hypothetical protein
MSKAELSLQCNAGSKLRDLMKGNEDKSQSQSQPLVKVSGDIVRLTYQFTACQKGHEFLSFGCCASWYKTGLRKCMR